MAKGRAGDGSGAGDSCGFGMVPGRFPDDSAEEPEGASQDSKTHCEQFKLLHRGEEALGL